MATYKRSERVADEIQKELSDIVTRKLKDPGVGLVTITSVKLSDDLKNARIYYTVMGKNEDRTESQRGLTRAVEFFRAELRQRMKLRVIPVLKFFYDDTLDQSIQVQKLLDEISREHQN
jgi:ribosome-binding factor A